MTSGMKVTEPNRISLHAVDRYMERHFIGSDRNDAIAELRYLLPGAEFVEAVESERQSIWKLLTGALIVVDETGLVRTVLPEDTSKTRYRPRK